MSEYDMVYGLTQGDILKMRKILEFTGYLGRVEQFYEDLVTKGMPSQKQMLIAHLESELEKARKLP
jgi:hypothetical protein